VAKVRGAMIYPISIFIVMGICLFLMLTMVVPKLTDLFTEGGKELPTSTQILLKLSEFAQDDWPYLLIGILMLMLSFMVMKRTKKGQYTLHLGLLYVPVFGKLVRELMVSRFARLLASLTGAGVPIVKALEINANAVGNDVYKRRIQYAAQDVSQGIPLGENLNQSAFLFPPTVASMVLVGEQTAKVGEVAGKIADFYEEEVDTAVASLSKLMEPVILVVMGSMVGFIVAAIMQPIMSLSDISTTL
jgi:type IV pilus assembly protein PilC